MLWANTLCVKLLWIAHHWQPACTWLVQTIYLIVLGAALLMWIAVEGKRKQGKSNAELNIKAESRAETKHQPGHTHAPFFQAASFLRVPPPQIDRDHLLNTFWGLVKLMMDIFLNSQIYVQWCKSQGISHTMNCEFYKTSYVAPLLFLTVKTWAAARAWKNVPSTLLTTSKLLRLTLVARLCLSPSSRLEAVQARRATVSTRPAWMLDSSNSYHS